MLVLVFPCGGTRFQSMKHCAVALNEFRLSQFASYFKCVDCDPERMKTCLVYLSQEGDVMACCRYSGYAVIRSFFFFFKS